jgi:TROVE domain-containing protein
LARYNRRPSGIIVPSPIVTQPVATGHTYNQAPGFARDAKSELFLLAVTNLVTQDTHYEKATARDQRYLGLIHQVAAEDPAWLARFLSWLRREANMRTAALVGALEFVKARQGNPLTRVNANTTGLLRQTVGGVLVRADEPGEALAYWINTHGRNIPKPVKRGIADAAQHLYNERNTLKYDTESKAFRFGDVLELCHVAPNRMYQEALFKHLIDRRHGRAGMPEGLRMIERNAWVRANVASGNMGVLLNSDVLREAGMTWEDALSLAGSNVPKKDLWEALIPTMGVMALLRNLRNFDEAGVSDAAAQTVIDKFRSADEVRGSRVLPMRMLSAYRSVSNLRWGYPLEQALEHSLANVPALDGETLILIDTSGSMRNRMSDRSELLRWDAAALFGLALAKRAERPTVVSYAGRSSLFPVERSASLLVMYEAFRRTHLLGGNTATEGTLRAYFREGFKRVVIVTDEQADAHGQGAVGSWLPSNVLLVTFNVAGYQMGHGPSGSANRVTVGGLSDAAFQLLPMLDRRAAGGWPF